MPQYELVTYMTRQEPSRIGSPGRQVCLPLEIKILTSYNSWLGDGLWETKVVWTNPDGKDFLMQSCATLDLPDKQHYIIVKKYEFMGYEIAEQQDSGAVRQPNRDNKLRELLKASGLEHLL